MIDGNVNLGKGSFIIHNVNHYYSGDPIPKVEYATEEVETWALIYRQLKELMPTHTCQAHQDVFALLEREGIYSENSIPQLEDVSRFMKSEFDLFGFYNQYSRGTRERNN